MINYVVTQLLCEEERLSELLEIPFSEILSCCTKADTIDTKEALCYLADMLIDNCGINHKLCGFTEYCATYWLKKNKISDGVKTLTQFLSYVSENYNEGLLDRYNSCVMSDKELRDILVEQLRLSLDEKTKIILCAGFVNAIYDCGDISRLDVYSVKKIEEGIIHLKDKNLISYRHSRDTKRYNLSTEANTKLVKYRFSEEEVSHFIVLNNRLVELQREIMNNVKVITLNLQEQITKGYYQYDTFCIEGLIYIDPYDDDWECDELIKTLTDFVSYSVVCSNDKTTEERMDAEIINNIHWYANWSGIFHQLEGLYSLRLCRAFRYLFEEDHIFTIDDIMKIKPEMLIPHIKIDI